MSQGGFCLKDLGGGLFLFSLALFGTHSLFGQHCHLFFFPHGCLKEFCQEGRKHPPEHYSVMQRKGFLALPEDSSEI